MLQIGTRDIVAANQERRIQRRGAWIVGAAISSVIESYRNFMRYRRMAGHPNSSACVAGSILERVREEHTMHRH